LLGRFGVPETIHSPVISPICALYGLELGGFSRVPATELHTGQMIACPDAPQEKGPLMAGLAFHLRLFRKAA
jgi:hypothetical protein